MNHLKKLPVDVANEHGASEYGDALTRTLILMHVSLSSAIFIFKVRSSAQSSRSSLVVTTMRVILRSAFSHGSGDKHALRLAQIGGGRLQGLSVRRARQ